MASFVRVKKPLLIVPSESTPSRVLALSSLDSQLFLRFTVEYLLVYKPMRTFDRPGTVARVKSALARALVPYYPLAGRVRARPDGSGLEVVCRGQGVGFIEAEASEYTMSDFGNAPEKVTEWRKLLSSDELFKVVPPLVVQLTWLADGSAALGIGFAHCICDGFGSSQFLKLFSELATGKTKLSELKCKPVWERHLLEAHTISTKAHPEFSRVPDLCRFNSRFSHDRLSPTSTTFDKPRINELKNIARVRTSQLSGYSTYTTFEVLTAHVWRSWARSLNLPPKQTLKLLFSVNIRHRVKTSLPDSYYGNAFVLGCAQTSAKDLVEGGLGYAAELVRRAKERVGDEYVREVVESVSWPKQASPDSVGVLIVSQWSRMGLDGVDFGLGRPVHVGPVCSDRYCLMLPVHDRTDAVKVMVAVPTDAVDCYKYLLRSPSS